MTDGEGAREGAPQAFNLVRTITRTVPRASSLEAALGAPEAQHPSTEQRPFLAGADPRHWLETLRIVLDTCLQSRFPTAVVWGADSVFYCNEPFGAYVHSPNSAAVGRAWAEVDCTLRAHLDPAIGAVRASGCATSVERASVAFVRQGRDEQITVSYSCSPIRVTSGEVAGVLCTVVEATDLARDLADARQFADHERRRADALADENRKKTIFLGSVSDRFRTPLTLLLGPIEEALSAPAGTLSSEGLRSAHRNAERLLKLVDALFEYSRIDTARATASFAPTELGALTSEVAQAFAPAIVRGGLALEVACESGAPVLVDREMWTRIVLHLLSNALKFTFEGSVRVAQRRVADTIELAVTDTGVGIAELDRARVFERFSGVRPSRARTREGCGVGLALARDLARIHGGDIVLTSSGDTGTTFTVRMPARTSHVLLATSLVGADSPSITGLSTQHLLEALRWLPDGERASFPHVAESAPGFENAGERARLLLVDDDEDIRNYLFRLLSRRWDVDVAEDGAVALDLARSKKPDLVLTDVMMPGLDGLELLRELRSDPRLRDIPVVMLSARAGEESRLASVRAGVDDYLVKPFSARELVARVDAQLARAKVRAIEGAHVQRLASIFRSAPVGIAILRGPEHVFEFANAGYLSLVADRPLLGLPMRDALPELAARGIHDLLDRVYETAEPDVVRSVRMNLERQASGVVDEQYFDFVYQPLIDPAGAVEGIVVVCFDVTALAKARREAESASRAKDEFLAILGHELRNPLAPILTALHLIRQQGADAAMPEVTIIERQVRHLVRLVDDLLDVSRVASGKSVLKKERIEISDVLSRAIEMAAPLLEERRHRLGCQLARGLFVDVDVARMAQVFSNLLTNAAKYTPHHGDVFVSAEADGDEVVIRIRDSGMGIPAEMLPRVFDLFVQAEQGLERSQGGLGLGLAIVRGLVERHGGTVSASSRGEGRGSEFEVRLASAAAGDEPKDGLVARASSPSATPARRVLIVDDNQDAALLLGDMLARIGYITRVAHDGPSAMLLAAEFEPELALLDIGLPVMDGYELARRLRELPKPPARLIAVTGYGRESDRRRSGDAGFAAHLVKPIDLQALLALLASGKDPRGS